MITEQDLLPPEPVMVAAESQQVDGRGWLMVMIAMVVIGLWSLKPAPAPSEPHPIPYARSEAWMADALPGVGIKTRDQQWQRIRAGQLDTLPASARAIARQVFTWDESHQTSGGAPLSHQ